MSLFNRAKYLKALGEEKKKFEHQDRMLKDHIQVKKRNDSLIDKYRDRVAKFVKDVIQDESSPAKPQQNYQKKPWQGKRLSQTYQSAKMLSAGQNVFSKNQTDKDTDLIPETPLFMQNSKPMQVEFDQSSRESKIVHRINLGKLNLNKGYQTQQNSKTALSSLNRSKLGISQGHSKLMDSQTQLVDGLRTSLSKTKNNKLLSCQRNSTQLSMYYNIKESPKGFRYADTVFERRQSLIKQNNECDTSPTAGPLVFNQQIRSISRQKQRQIGSPHMHLKAYQDIDRICEAKIHLKRRDKLEKYLNGQFENSNRKATGPLRRTTSLQKQLERDTSKVTFNLMNGPDYNRSKQSFFKNKIASYIDTNEKEQMPKKTFFKSGSSLLMNEEKIANHSLNLQNQIEGPCVQLKQLIKYKNQTNPIDFYLQIPEND